MKCFTDSNGKGWNVNITALTVKELKDMLNIDIRDLAADESLYESLSTDPVQLCLLLHTVCRKQSDGTEVSIEDFMEAISGDTIDAATDAFIGALIDFFPKSRRLVLSKAQQISRRVVDKTLKIMSDKLDDPQIEKMLEEDLQREFSKPASGLPPVQK